MGWNRQQFRAERKHLRHARISLDKAYCADCGRELAATHLVARFGERCKLCFEAFWQGMAVQTTSHEGR